MTIQELNEDLNKLNRQIRDLLRRSGYEENLDLFVSDVQDGTLSPDQYMLVDEFRRTFSHLESASAILDYLEKPLQKGEYVLRYNAATDRYECDGHVFTSGNGIEFLYYDDYEEVYKWVIDRIEYDWEKGGYCIYNYPSVQLDGLKVRFR